MTYLIIAAALLVAYLVYKIKNWGYNKAKRENEYEKNLQDKIFLSQLRDKDTKVYKMWQKTRESKKQNQEDEHEENPGIGSFL